MLLDLSRPSGERRQPFELVLKMVDRRQLDQGEGLKGGLPAQSKVVGGTDESEDRYS